MLLSRRCGGQIRSLHPEGPRLRKAALVATVAVLACLAGVGRPTLAQEPGQFGGVQSIGFSSSYSPDSSRILIGTAGQRRTWTVAAEYTHLLHRGPHFRLDYEGSVTPMFLESDPTVTGIIFTFRGVNFAAPQTPLRVISVNHGPIGTILTGGGTTIPIYGLFGRENTYAGAVAPLGARITALPRWRIQPSFALDLGFVASTRDIPVDDSSRFNYMFAVGPGVQIFSDRKTSWRLEYIYRHISNAGQGDQNPGVDQAVVRLTISHHR
jgi:hypothetical protein